MPVPRPIPGQIITRAKISDSTLTKSTMDSPALSSPTITGGSMSGTISGNPTLSGDVTFSGALDSTGGIHATRSSRAPLQFYDGDTPPSSTSLWNSISIGGTSAALGATAPTLTAFRGNIAQLAFTGTGASVQEVHLSVTVPHDILLGSNPEIALSWSHIIGAPSGDVKWQADVTVARSGTFEAFAAPTSYSVVQTASTQYYNHSVYMALSSGQAALCEPNSVVLIRIYRDPADVSDTFANDAYLLDVHFDYEIGQVGTKEQKRPFTSIS